MKTCFWCDLQEKILIVYFCKRWAQFLKSNNVGHQRHFARIFRDSTQIFRGFAHIFTDFGTFQQIKILGVRLHPLHPRLLHPWE